MHAELQEGRYFSLRHQYSTITVSDRFLFSLIHIVRITLIYHLTVAEFPCGDRSCFIG